MKDVNWWYDCYVWMLLQRWEFLMRSICLMHNICNGDSFLGLEKVKSLWEEEIFGYVLWSFQVGVKLLIWLCWVWLMLVRYEICMKVVMEDLDK